MTITTAVGAVKGQAGWAKDLWNDLGRKSTSNDSRSGRSCGSSSGWQTMGTGIHNTMALDIVLNVDNAIKQVMDVRQRFFIRFVKRRYDIVIKVDKGNCTVRKSVC